MDEHNVYPDGFIDACQRIYEQIGPRSWDVGFLAPLKFSISVVPWQ